MDVMFELNYHTTGLTMLGMGLGGTARACSKMFRYPARHPAPVFRPPAYGAPPQGARVSAVGVLGISQDSRASFCIES